jgi:succinoglycan biosynthesis protein ExoO
MNPEVSVIVPAYNTEVYIVRAIESALGQTEKNIEVIVVDDGSTDATVEVARSIPDKRLKVLVNQKNIGVSSARNRALREAQGKWIAVLDSDDWYAPERLEKLLQVAYVEDADLIADDLYFIQDGEKSPQTTFLLKTGLQIDKIRQIDAITFVETDMPGQRVLSLGLTKPLVKRDFLVQHGIEYDETIEIGEDFAFYLKCLVSGARFILIPEAYYFYRARQGSLVTQSRVKHFNQSWRLTLNFLQEEEVVKNNPALVRALSKNLAAFEKNIAYYSVVEPIKRGDLLEALIEMVHNPYFIVHFLTKMLKFIYRT